MRNTLSKTEAINELKRLQPAAFALNQFFELHDSATVETRLWDLYIMALDSEGYELLEPDEKVNFAFMIRQLIELSRGLEESHRLLNPEYYINPNLKAA